MRLKWYTTLIRKMIQIFDWCSIFYDLAGIGINQFSRCFVAIFGNVIIFVYIGLRSVPRKGILPRNYSSTVFLQVYIHENWSSFFFFVKHLTMSFSRCVSISLLSFLPAQFHLLIFFSLRTSISAWLECAWLEVAHRTFQPHLFQFQRDYALFLAM